MKLKLIALPLFVATTLAFGACAEPEIEEPEATTEELEEPMTGDMETEEMEEPMEEVGEEAE